jgi:glycerophosphoryl diester phosphodiesterase
MREVRCAAMIRWKWAVTVTIGLAAVTACSSELHPFIESRRSPLLFAHRGGGGVAPEATLPTLLSAQDDPEAIVEFDVHRSKDGHLVVIHDDTVDRTTDGSGRVDELTLAQLQALDAGFCTRPNVGDGTASLNECRSAPASDFPFRGRGYRIPTLTEVLSALDLRTAISIEVKAPGFEADFAQMMRASGRMDGLVVGSALDDVAIRLQELLPELPHYLPEAAATCFALTSKLGLDYAACPRYDIFASPLTGAGLALDTDGILSDAHRVGTAVVYWTINTELDMERLFRLGADGIFTDYPATARQVLERLRAGGALP